MSFQSTIAIRQGFDVPGEIFQDVPWTVLSWTLNSSGTPNLVGSTAFTITAEGFAEAGNGGTLGFAGILCAPKSYTLTGLNGNPLAPTLELPDFTQGELLTRGMLAVLLPAAASIGDYIIYDNTTGALASMSPSSTLPSGFSSAHAVVSQFNQTISGEGIAVIYVDATGTNADGGPWPYVNSLWLASDGLDTNPGSSQELPRETFLGLQSLITAPTVINIVDVGTYVIPSTFTVAHPLFINTPGATIEWTGSPGGIMFALNVNSPVVGNIGNIRAANALSIFRGFSSCILSGPGGFCNITSTAGVRVWEDANTISGGVNEAVFSISTDRFGADFLFAFAGTQIVNAVNLGDGNISSQLPSGIGNGVCKINANFWNGVASGAADFAINLNRAGSSFGFTSSGVLNLNAGTSDLDLTTIPFNGLVNSNPASAAYPGNLFNNPLYFFQQPIIGELYSVIYTAPSTGSWSFLPGVQNGNQIILIPANAGNGVITLPAGSSVPLGWRMPFMQTVGSGASVIIYPGSNDTLNGQNSVGPGATSCFTGIGTGKFVRGAANGGGGFDWAVENCYTSN